MNQPIIPNILKITSLKRIKPPPKPSFIGILNYFLVFLAGYSPWVPWHDFHHQLMFRDGESLSIDIDDYYEMSMAWLVVSDAVLVLPGWLNSKGTVAEVDKASRLNIPIFHSLEDLKNGLEVD